MKRWTSQDTDSLASSITRFWLTNAERIIADGGRPAKLSDSEDLFRDSLSEYAEAHEVEFPSKREQKRLTEQAMQWAKDWLRDGRYPTVLEFFRNRNAMNRTAFELVKIAKELVSSEPDLKSEVERELKQKFPQFVFRTRRSPRGIIKVEAEPPSAGLPRFVEWVDPQMFGETEWNPNASRERQFEKLLRQVEFYLTKVWKQP